MAGGLGEAGRVDRWGPVCRGFRVTLPDGERGCVEDIRLGDDAVEIVVATGLFVRRFVTVRAHEIEAILPAARRIVVRGSNGAVAARHAAAKLATAGSVVRMPVRPTSPIDSPPGAA